MVAIHPWARGFAVGFLAFCFLLPYSFDLAFFAACAVGVVVSRKLDKDQQAFEEKLLYRKRLYCCDIEQVFAGIQRALANAWLNESHWQNRMTELASGYLLYRYDWREPQSAFDDGSTRRHANLQIECDDCSDLDGPKTVVTFSFDGLPNPWTKRTFYEAIHVAMETIDAYLPEQTVLRAECDCRQAHSQFTDRDFFGG